MSIVMGNIDPIVSRAGHSHVLTKNFAHHPFNSLVSRSFLFSKEGNPNKRNVHNETCLHVLCQGPMILLLSAGALSPRLARPERDEQLRADCLQVSVQFTKVCLNQRWG